MNDHATVPRSEQRRASDTRARLLASTRDCVRVHGLSGTTSREITSAAGANLASITYHFGSKDDLVAEALFDELRSRLEPALALLAAEGDPASAMLAAVQRLTADFERSRRDAPIYLEALVLASHGGAFATAARRLLRSVQRRVRDRIEELVAAGFAPAWVDAEAMASLVVAVANGVALQTTLDPRGPGAEAMAGQFAALLAGAGGG
jgi:AcrR family transcriptional regulator